MRWPDVAAGLPRHSPNPCNTVWRHKAAATTFFSNLLDANVLFSAAYRPNAGLRQFRKLKSVILDEQYSQNRKLVQAFRSTAHPILQRTELRTTPVRERFKVFSEEMIRRFFPGEVPPAARS